MDTPAGLITAKAHVDNGKVKEVSIVNVPSFLYKKDLSVEMDGYGTINYDISFGGSFFAIVKSDQFDLTVEPKNASKLCDLGLIMRDEINKHVEIEHPLLTHINTVDLVEFYDAPTHPDADYKNVVIFGQGQVDRSPCGTGTSAKLATLHAKGKLEENQVFVYESILGTLFKGKILGQTKVGDYNAVTPEISGSAYITGFNHFVIDPEDPVKYGFTLR
jgi:proline racemase